MAEVKMMKAKTVPLKVGDTMADIQSANRAASQPETVEAYRARRAFLPEAENYQPPLPPSEMPMDILKSLASGGVSLGESALGQLGDLSDMRYTLAHYINDKMKGSSGMDLGEGIDNSQKYASANLPSTEDIASNVTDPLLSAMGPVAQEWGRYKPQTPWGQAANMGVQTFDPTEALLPGSKAFSMFKKAF